MDIRHIIALANAGYSAEEISHISNALETAPATPTAAPAAAAPATPAAAAPATPAAAPAAAPATPAAAPADSATLSAILDKLTQLTTAVHAANIAATEQPVPQTASAVIADLLSKK